MTRPGKSKALQHLRRLARQSAEYVWQNPDPHPLEFDKWCRDAEVGIRHTFGDGSTHVQEFQNAVRSSAESVEVLFSSMIDEVRYYWEDDAQTRPTQAMKTSDIEITNEVFVVHGRDEGAKDTVARFLWQLELEPIVLHEQPNQGRTIIEKFEDYAQVGFAVALLTPDDECVSQDGDGTPRYRARQNVIFELGYFIGKLGRNRTCALIMGDVEIPSDYDGVLYVRMDEGGAWKQQLVGEMKSAGLAIDANLMYSTADDA